MKLFVVLLLTLTSLASAKTPFKIGTYSEYPYSSGIETRFGIVHTPVQLKIKAGVLTPGYIKGGSNLLLELDKISLSDAVIFDNTYEQGTHLEFAVGTKLPQISSNLYMNAGLSVIQGNGSLPAADTVALITQGRPIQLGPVTEGYKLGLEGEIHMVQATIGYELPITKYLNLTSEFTLRHAYDSSLKAEYGPTVFKGALSERFDSAQKDGLKAMPLLPSILIGVNYGVNL